MFIVLVAVSLAGTMKAQSGNLLTNGSFEAPAIALGTFAIVPTVPGWVLVPGTAQTTLELWHHWNGWDSADGVQHAEIDSRVIEQVLTTNSGACYSLSFAYAPRPTVPDNHIVVEWGGQVVADIAVSGVGHSALDWTTHKLTVQASSSATAIRVSGVGSNPLVGMQVDDISVSHVALTYGMGCAGSGDFIPGLSACGSPIPGGNITVNLIAGLGGSSAFLFVGNQQASLPIGPTCTLNITRPIGPLGPYALAGSGAGAGSMALPATIPPTVAGGTVATLQAFVADPGVSRGYSNTSGLEVTVQ